MALRPLAATVVMEHTSYFGHCVTQWGQIHFERARVIKFVVSIFTEKLLWVIYGWYEICKLLLQNIEEDNPPMDNGYTPLHMAASNGHFEICKLIIGFVKRIKDLLNLFTAIDSKIDFFFLWIFYRRIVPHSFTLIILVDLNLQQSPKMCVMRKVSSNGDEFLEWNQILHKN